MAIYRGGFIASAHRIVITIVQGIVIISSLAITLAICLQSILRYVFKAPLLGLEEFAILTVLWLWFFGAVYATSVGFHITGGLPIKRKPVRQIMEVAYSSLGLILTLIFSYLLLQYCIFCIKEGAASIALRIPLIYCYGGTLLALVLVAVYLVREAVSRLHNLCKSRQRGSNEP